MDVWLSPECKSWIDALRDFRAQKKILARIRRAGEGNFGLTRSLSAGLSEMKIDEGPGYRVYFTVESGKLIVVLCGGDKSTQANDIRRAHELLEQKGWPR